MAPDDFSEKIELLINDEDRIVTYKTLSQELKIHVNKAKQCMMDFLNSQKSKGVQLEVHFFLAGITEIKGIKTLSVLVVSEDSLEKAKKNFSEITSCHIYSLYKGTSKDEFALYSADLACGKNREEYNKYSAIKHPNIETKPPVLSKMQKKDSEANSSSKMDSHVPSNESVSSLPEKDTKMKLSESVVHPEKNDPSSSHNDLKKSKSSPEEKKQKSGTLMSMWQKKEEKASSLKKGNHKADIKENVVAKNAPKSNILSMFSRQAEKNAGKEPSYKSTLPNDSFKKEVPEVINKEESSKNMSVNHSKKPCQKRKVVNGNRQTSKQKKNSDSENEIQPTVKKRRRICTFDDSDSESECEEEKEKAQRGFFLPEDPVEVPETAPMSDDELIPPTPPVVNSKGKARIWKTVQKTYEDEEGFFVTKKEKELVSASEDEEDPLKTETVKKNEEAVIKKSLAVNKKQSLLLSFFKQK